MTLAESFPDDEIERFADRQIEVGVVLKLLVTDTHPPKEKRFIVVGITDDRLCLAVVFINSHINPRINFSLELQSLHVPLTPENRPYIDRPCFADCAHLYYKEVDEISSSISKHPDCIIGQLADEDLKIIKGVLRESTTIKGKVKKKFGFYD